MLEFLTQFSAALPVNTYLSKRGMHIFVISVSNWSRYYTLSLLYTIDYAMYISKNI